MGDSSGWFPSQQQSSTYSKDLPYTPAYGIIGGGNGQHITSNGFDQ